MSAQSLDNSNSYDDSANALVERIGSYSSSVVVAFSGGVDSAVVAAAAFRALGSRAVAWTSLGAAVPQADREAAQAVAKGIGIRHVQFQTRELENPNYQANGPDRCYHCKSTLYQAIFEWANSEGFETIVSGTNADDLGDYRPGLKAATDHGVRAPLAELGLGKQHVRGIAHAWGLSVANKPASPCLASRIAYGQVVTLGRLQQIEGMEVWMHSQGFHDVRARLHADRLLRLEIAPEHLGMACESSMRARILGKAKELGFQYVTIDLNGRESGSMNRVLGDAQTQSIESGR